mmetsp:Transcript_28421/g.111472  ORF Transcript_28421/g.111472 Transcript_28421/m.111472 type:complete len:127 (+) Transcript_28421:1450-1830(+)
METELLRRAIGNKTGEPHEQLCRELPAAESELQATPTSTSKGENSKKLRYKVQGMMLTIESVRASVHTRRLLERVPLSERPWVWPLSIPHNDKKLRRTESGFPTGARFEASATAHAERSVEAARLP